MTFFIAAEYPEHFAAIAPLAGGGDPESGCRLKSVPTWVFHGEKDNTIPLDEAQEMIKSVETCGGNVQLTVYPDRGHDVSETTYNDPKLYTWLRKHLTINGIHTGVQVQEKLTTTWGTLKH